MLTARETLAAAVRQAAVAAGSDDDFFSGLRAAGLNVKLRRLLSGDIVGYSVNMPGDRAGDDTPIWFGGSRLAPDLSLPRVRQRWGDVAGGERVEEHAAAAPQSQSPVPSRPLTRAQRRAAAWQQAGEAVEQARAVLSSAGDPRSAAAAAALADLLTAAASQAPSVVRRELVLAARAFEQAGRMPWRQTQASRQIRGAMWALLDAGRALSSGHEGVAVLKLIVAAVAAVRAVSARHQAAQMQAHARAARLAAAHLQSAAERLGARPRARADYHAATRPDLRYAVCQAVAGQADPAQVLADPAWPALAGMLARIEAMGADPAVVLREVVAQRPLREGSSSTARSVARVLVWRLQHWAAAGSHSTATRGEEPVVADRPARSAPSGVATASRPPSAGTAAARAAARQEQFVARAAVAVVETQRCSIAMIQQKVWVNEGKARELLRELRRRGFVAPAPNGKGEVVLVSREALPALREVAAARGQAVRLTSATASVAPPVSSRSGPLAASSPQGTKPPRRGR